MGRICVIKYWDVRVFLFQQGVSEFHHPDAVNHDRPGAAVCISVGVIRASGLKVLVPILS